VPVVGRLQARRERKRGLQVPGGVAEDVVGELESKYVLCRVLSVVLCLPIVAGMGSLLGSWCDMTGAQVPGA
jgi:hypothetical protein